MPPYTDPKPIRKKEAFDKYYAATLNGDPATFLENFNLSAEHLRIIFKNIQLVKVFFNTAIQTALIKSNFENSKKFNVLKCKIGKVESGIIEFSYSFRHEDDGSITVFKKWKENSVIKYSDFALEFSRMCENKTFSFELSEQAKEQ